MTLALNVPLAALTDIARLLVDGGADQATRDGADFGTALSDAQDKAVSATSPDEPDQALADPNAAIPAVVPADALALLAVSGLVVDPPRCDLAARAPSIATRDFDVHAVAGETEAQTIQLDSTLRQVGDSGSDVAPIGGYPEGSPGAVSDSKLEATGRESRTQIAIPLEELAARSDAKPEVARRVRNESDLPAPALAALSALSTNDPLRAQLTQVLDARSENASERSNASIASRPAWSTRADLAATGLADASALALQAHETVPDVAKASAKADSSSYAPQTAVPTVLATPTAATGFEFARSIATPVNAPGFGEEVAQTLTHAVTRGHDRIELRLHPDELGPVDVRIDYKAGEATLVIVATQPSTRDALEQALPQLRDQLAFQGIALAEATVRDGTSDRQPPFDAPRTVADHSEHAPKAAPAPAVVLPRAGRGLVDTFA